MNKKKFWIAFVVVFVVMEVLNFLIHGVILSSTYEMESVASAFRPEAEMQGLMWIMWILDLIWVYFFVFFFVKGYENKGIMEGVRFGVYMGLFVNLVAAYAQYAFYPLPYSLALQWFIYGFIVTVILGVLVSFIYTEEAVAEE